MRSAGTSINDTTTSPITFPLPECQKFSLNFLISFFNHHPQSTFLGSPLQQVHRCRPLYLALSSMTHPLDRHLRPFTTSGALLSPFPQFGVVCASFDCALLCTAVVHYHVHSYEHFLWSNWACWFRLFMCVFMPLPTTVVEALCSQVIHMLTSISCDTVSLYFIIIMST